MWVSTILHPLKSSKVVLALSVSYLDEQPLTTNHLLHLCPGWSWPPGIFNKSDLCCKRAWRQAQYLADVFWRRWTKEYLPPLLERKKWNTKKRNLEVGDVVLIGDEKFPRGTCLLAGLFMDKNYGRACSFVASQSQTFFKKGLYGEHRSFNSESGLLHQKTVFVNCVL